MAKMTVYAAIRAGKESACSAGDTSSIPGSGRSAGEGNAKPLQYSCLGNPRDRGAWQATVHGVAESDMTEHTQCFYTRSLLKQAFGFLGNEDVPHIQNPS